MRSFRTVPFFTSAALVALVAGGAASAQQASADSEDATGSEFEEIVVTGSASGGISQFESSVAVTTFNAEAIREKAPLTITDLYGEVPGIWAETSGGESAANLFVRGIPAPGQFRFTKLQVDGLPVYDETGLPFAPPEGFVKVDQTLRRVEAIRGGTATIFSSNAAGGIINNITRKGTQEEEGFIGVTYGDFNLFRVDGFAAGPISDRVTYAVGGFYRVDDGVRDPGFTANKGGQIRGKLTYELDEGELNISGHFIDDKNLFYLPIPLAIDGDGDLTSIAGFDAQTDTLTSDDVRRVQIALPGETRERDLSDGINTEGYSFQIDYEQALGDWTMQNKARYHDGSTVFNAIFSLTPPVDAQDYLDGRLADAQAAFDGTDSLALRFLSDGVGGESTFGFGSNNGNGLVIESGWWNVETEVESFVNDLQFKRTFDAGGEHAVVFGAYGSFANYTSQWNFNNILQEVAGSPRGLEVLAVDDAGEVIGAVTQNSFTQYGSFFRNYDSDVRILALYANDEWQVTEDLRIDFGARYEALTIDGAAERLGTFDISSTNSLIQANGLQTLADDNVTFGTGQFDSFDETYNEFAWAIGANYTINDKFAVYARANDAFRTPDPNDLAANPAAAGDLPVNDIFQAEAGIKVDTPYLRAFVTGFYSEFTNQIFSDPIQDENGNTIEAQTLLESETFGIEAEVIVGPFAGFSVNTKLTLQDPEITGFEVVGDSAPTGLVGADFVGNEVQRIARRILIVEPRYGFEIEGATGAVFASIFSVGDRFANNGNTTILPGYTTLGVGATVNYGNLEFTLTGDNLTNEIGLTEGNPRQDFFATGDVAVANFGRPIVGRNFRFSLGYRF